MAEVVAIGQPVNDVEREAVAFLRDRLPDDYLVFHNIEMGEPGRAPYECDLIVVGELAVYAIEVKGFYGRVSGNKRDWFVDGRHRRSPLPLAFQKARVISGMLRRHKPPVGPVWIEALVFLANPDVDAHFPPQVAEHVHTRDTIVNALTSRDALHLPHWPIREAHERREEIRRFLLGGHPAPPRTHVGPYRLLGSIAQTEFFTDYEATNEALIDPNRPDPNRPDPNNPEGPVVRLRLYRVDPYAPPEDIEQQRRRGIWEASVLRWLGDHPGLVSAGDPFFPEAEDIAVALPFEQAPGVTLRSYLETHGHLSTRDVLPSFGAAIQALALAHSKGIVHRRISPDAFLCEPDRPFRLADFAFSAKLRADKPLDLQALHPRYTAPEVLDGGPATPASDLFSLGAVLAESVWGTLPFRDSRRATLPPALPQDGQVVDAICSMLARDPGDRPQDGYALIEQLLPDAGLETFRMNTGDVLLANGSAVNGEYLIERRLGPPRTRTVYQARHQTTRMLRALRVFEADDALLQQLREAFGKYYVLRHESLRRVDRLERIRSPHVTGPNGEPLYFFDIEFVPGEPLSQIIARGGLGARRAIGLARDLCDLLEYLSRRGVSHGGIGHETTFLADDGRLMAFVPITLLPSDVLSPPLLRYLDPASPPSLSQDLSATAILCWEMATGAHPLAEGLRAPDAALELRPEQTEDPQERRLLEALAQVIAPLLESGSSSAPYSSAASLGQALARILEGPPAA